MKKRILIGGNVRSKEQDRRRERRMKKGKKNGLRKGKVTVKVDRCMTELRT
jgi:hypothetical protein